MGISQWIAQHTADSLVLLAQTTTVVVQVEKPSGGTSWVTIATAIAALAAPLVSLVIAYLVTSRTISNDREQRQLDREADRLNQVHERQLSASADFLHSASRALVRLLRLHPENRPSSSELRTSNDLVEDARRELPRVQLLFRRTNSVVAATATRVLDGLTTAQRMLEVYERTMNRTAASAPDRSARVSEGAKAAADYKVGIDQAKGAYDALLEQVAAEIVRHPDPRS